MNAVDPGFRRDDGVQELKALFVKTLYAIQSRWVK